MVVSKKSDSGHEVSRPDLKTLYWAETQKVLARLQDHGTRVEACLKINRHSPPITGNLYVSQHGDVYFWGMECPDPKFIICITQICSDKFSHLIINTKCRKLLDDLPTIVVEDCST